MLDVIQRTRLVHRFPENSHRPCEKLLDTLPAVKLLCSAPNGPFGPLSEASTLIGYAVGLRLLEPQFLARLAAEPFGQKRVVGAVRRVVFEAPVDGIARVANDDLGDEGVESVV